MAKLVQLSDLVNRLSGRPKTIEAPDPENATPALGLLLNSPTRLKEQLERNLPEMSISIKREGPKLKITSTKKVAEEPRARRRESKKPCR